MDTFLLSRRDLLKAAGASLTLGTTLASLPVQAAAPVDSGRVQDGKVRFPNWRGDADAPSPPPPDALPPSQRVGFAVVGLGRLALEEILPAFAVSKRARLAALVSGSPDKAALVSRQYGVAPQAVYDYGNFDQIADNADIQAVYIVLPNALHREFVERAAKAGKHVLCEKPMAITPEDCRAMIQACKANARKLMIAYRCQYEPRNRALLKQVRNGEWGKAKLIDASNTQSMAAPTQWRLRKDMAGGGALVDIGLYCLNAARFLTGEEPAEVFARMHSPPLDERFAQVEETIAFMLRFPSGVIANCDASYNAHETKQLSVRMEKGWADLANAFSYHGQQLKLGAREQDHNRIDQQVIEEKNQFALELDHMAQCIREDRTPRTPGEEGLQDHIIMEALYRSAREGQPVSLESDYPVDFTRGPALEEKN